MQYPNTLVLTESPFSSTNGFGATLSTLLGEWPRDRYLVLYRSAEFWDPTCRQLQGAQDRMVHMPLPRKPLYRPAHLREFVDQLVPFLTGRTPFRIPGYSRRWIEDVLAGWKPDVIYCWYYAPVVADYGSWLSRLLGVPLVIHVGDDAPTGRRERAVRDIVRAAAARIAISGEMKRHFEDRFEAPFEVVHNGASDLLFAPRRAQPDRTGPLVLRYVGSLLRAHHWHAIEDIAEAVRRYNGSGGRARFDIYGARSTAELARELEDGDNVLYAGFAEKPRYYELLKTADLLVLPITFDEAEFPWVRLSMPTKLPEYLGSGAPTLVYGPRGCAPVEFCVENGVGIVQAERSVAALVRILERLGDEREEFRQKAARDSEVAEAKVSARAMSERLQRILLGVVEDGAGVLS